jgi:hypothetical protein
MRNRNSPDYGHFAVDWNYRRELEQIADGVSIPP